MGTGARSDGRILPLFSTGQIGSPLLMVGKGSKVDQPANAAGRRCQGSPADVRTGLHPVGFGTSGYRRMADNREISSHERLSIPIWETSHKPTFGPE